MSTWWESFNLPESIRYGKEDYEYLWSIRPDKPHKVKIYGRSLILHDYRRHMEGIINLVEQ